MKAYCEICGIAPASFRGGIDSKTGEEFEDLCCDTCHLVIATVSERNSEIEQLNAKIAELKATITELIAELGYYSFDHPVLIRARKARDTHLASDDKIVLLEQAAKTILKEMRENYNEHEPMNSWASMLNEALASTDSSNWLAEHDAEMEKRKDDAYLERNRVVAALAKLFPSGIERTAIEGWSEDWHSCVYIDLPTGQVSWHYHDSHAFLFAGLQP